MKTFLLAAVCLYATLCAYLYLAQRALLYFPETVYSRPEESGLPDAKEEKLRTADGETIIVWHIAPAGEDKPVIIYFHGNAGSIYYRGHRFAALSEQGFGIIGVSYRGYGGSTGSPTEQGLIEDARAAYAFALKHYPASRIVLWGESLGSAVAIALASEKPVAKIVLEAPFTSIADVAAHHYWYVPVKLLIKDPFYSDRRIEKVTAAVLVLHGANDAVVPIRFGEALYALIKGPKKFHRFDSGGHNDLSLQGAVKVAAEFLAAKP